MQSSQDSQAEVLTVNTRCSLHAYHTLAGSQDNGSYLSGSADVVHGTPVRVRKPGEAKVIR